MKTITVNTSSSYNVYIGDNILGNSGDYAEKLLGKCRIAVVSDTNTHRLFSEKVIGSLKNFGFSVVEYIMPEGEKSKNPETLFGILSFLAESGFTRKDAVFALGGGVVGDTAGLAAALYMRGIRLVQLPTTVLAAVDSSVGGKTAINIEKGKNLVGAFHQPEFVLCDTETLLTLPKEIYNDGFAEIIKCAMIADSEIFRRIDEKSSMEEIISRCVSIKKNAVEQDEFDNGSRMLLNFGHTVGHAVERCTNFQISHGKAVAVGMAVITRACVRTGKCGQEVYNELENALLSFDLPIRTAISAEELFNTAISDKKSNGSGVTLVLPVGRGRCELYKTGFEELKEMIRLGL